MRAVVSHRVSVHEEHWSLLRARWALGTCWLLSRCQSSAAATARRWPARRFICCQRTSVEGLSTFYIPGSCVAPTTGPGVWQVLGKWALLNGGAAPWKWRECKYLLEGSSSQRLSSSQLQSLSDPAPRESVLCVLSSNSCTVLVCHNRMLQTGGPATRTLFS